MQTDIGWRKRGAISVGKNVERYRLAKTWSDIGWRKRGAISVGENVERYRLAKTWSDIGWRKRRAISVGENVERYRSARTWTDIYLYSACLELYSSWLRFSRSLCGWCRRPVMVAVSSVEVKSLSQASAQISCRLPSRESRNFANV